MTRTASLEIQAFEKEIWKEAVLAVRSLTQTLFVRLPADSSMQSIRPSTSRLARAFVHWPAPTTSGCPRRLHSTLSPTRPCLASSRGSSHTDEANRSAILKRPRKLPPGAPTSQLFLDLLQVSPVRARPQLINEDSARALVKAWGVDKMHDVTVVDAYSGALPCPLPPFPDLPFPRGR